MDFTAIPSIGSYTKQLGMKMKWQQKKSSGNFTADGTKSLSEWIEAQKKKMDETDSMSSQKKDQKLNSIRSKLYAGGKLTLEEKQYLQRKDPVTYQKVKDNEAEQASFEQALKRCKTKEDVQRLKMSHTAASLSTVNSIRNNPHIPEGTKLGLVMAEHQKMKALEKITQKFVESGEYAKLPTEAERRKAEKDMAEAKEAEQAGKDRDREIEETEQDKADVEKTESVENDLTEDSADLPATGDTEAVQKTEKADRNAEGAKQRKLDEVGKPEMTRAKAEQTPEARKVKRSKAKAAYLQNSADASAMIYGMATSKLESRA